VSRPSIAGVLLVTVAALATSTSAAPPPLRVAAPEPVEATGIDGASVSFHVKAYDPDSGNPIAASCSPPGSGGSGDFDVTGTFPIGETTVVCSATLENGSPVSESLTVTVRDTTPPAIGDALGLSAATTTGDATQVNYTPPTATDLGQEVPVVCTPPPGSLFPLGNSPVQCTATDGRGNSATKGFQVLVTLVDEQPPSFTSAPASIGEVEATSSRGAVVSFATPVAVDNVGMPTVTCAPGSGSTFPLGTTTVICTATDTKGNQATTSFTVTVRDRTPPTLSVPGDQTVETEFPAGASVTYSATATDTVSGAITPNCAPPSGATFAVGTTPVQCTAVDAAGNSSPPATFNVNVVLVDRTAPTLAGVPAAIQREANGPLGSIVDYTPPTAADNRDSDPLLVTCTPASGSTFPLGTTAVTCTATDSHGNTGMAVFSVRIVDTVEPVLTPPGDRNVYATTPDGIPREDPAVAALLGGGTASDIVDQTLVIGNNAPGFFPIGTTIITFTTSDDSGNSAQATASLTVFPMPAPGTTPPPLPQPPARTPPDDVRGLKATVASRQVTLTWSRPTAPDFDHVSITRTVADRGDSTVVYTGNALRYVDRSVQNEIEYRYTVVSFDTQGNRSAGAVVTAVPRQLLLLTPRDGAQVSGARPVRLTWARIRGAAYYNVQLYFTPDLRMESLSPAKAQAPAKVLSVWPKKNRFVLKKTWRFAGVRYTLRAGLYRWFVWPGQGARRDANYGPLMGSSTFVVG
jgi:HYR domain